MSSTMHLCVSRLQSVARSVCTLLFVISELRSTSGRPRAGLEELHRDFDVIGRVLRGRSARVYFGSRILNSSKSHPGPSLGLGCFRRLSPRLGVTRPRLISNVKENFREIRYWVKIQFGFSSCCMNQRIVRTLRLISLVNCTLGCLRRERG